MDVLVKRNGNIFPALLSDIVETNDFFNTNLLDREFSLFSPKLITDIPSANITENGKNYIVELAVPGMEKKDFNIELEKEFLTVRAEKEEKKTEKQNCSTRKEFSYNSFSRSFRLPENCKTEKIKAAYENGILKIEIPKNEVTVSKPKKKITIS